MELECPKISSGLIPPVIGKERETLMGSNLSKVTGKLVVELTAARRPPNLQFHTLSDVPHWQEQEIGRRLEVNVSYEHWWWECCH